MLAVLIAQQIRELFFPFPVALAYFNSKKTRPREAGFLSTLLACCDYDTKKSAAASPPTAIPVNTPIGVISAAVATALAPGSTRYK